MSDGTGDADRGKNEQKRERRVYHENREAQYQDQGGAGKPRQEPPLVGSAGAEPELLAADLLLRCPKRGTIIVTREIHYVSHTREATILAGAGAIDEALDRVGQLLAARRSPQAIVILGGAALNLLGIVERATTDVDIVATADAPVPEHDGAAAAHPRHIYSPPQPLPTALTDAARIVARDLDLPDDWLNSGPALQWRAGLPPGLERRVHWRPYSALWLGSSIDTI